MAAARCGQTGSKLPVPVLVGVLPLQSFRHAEFLHNEVPGITIPQWVRDRMQAAGSAGRDEIGGLARLDHVGHATGTDRDHGKARGLSLGQYHGELLHQAREQREIGRIHPAHHRVTELPEKTDRLRRFGHVTEN